MNDKKGNGLSKFFPAFFLFAAVLNCEGFLNKSENVSSLRLLLPEVDHWKLSERPQSYNPATLFEYINGAAEIYLSYDFRELMVGQYEKEGNRASLSVEIYDMGNNKNSFGIYSAERFPESRFVAIGNQGYVDEGALNFMAGRLYVKLLCFDCGEETDEWLKSFSREIVSRVAEVDEFPSALQFFPAEGLVRNSEKFILRNFLGYEFLHDGYMANYRLDHLEFDCFIIEGKHAEEAREMMKKYLDKKDRESIKEIHGGYLIKDRYYANIYMGQADNFLFGVMKIEEGSEEVGKAYFEKLLKSVRMSR